jgi:hypothetical protein
MGTCGIIFTSLLGLLCIASIVCAIWDYNDKRGYRDIGITCACLYAFFAFAFGTHSKTLYEQERDYPYTKTLYVKLYYIDGGTEIKTFNCEGHEQPHLTPGKGYCWFKLDGHSIPCVSRYEIIKEDRFYKNE